MGMRYCSSAPKMGTTRNSADGESISSPPAPRNYEPDESGGAAWLSVPWGEEALSRESIGHEAPLSRSVPPTDEEGGSPTGTVGGTSRGSAVMAVGRELCMVAGSRGLKERVPTSDPKEREGVVSWISCSFPPFPPWTEDDGCGKEVRLCSVAGAEEDGS